MAIKKAQGFYETFDRSGSVTRDTHYCPGCGPGIIHKLLCEALAEMGIQDDTIIVNPIGCAVFGYYYWDVGNVGAAHGRAQSLATAINRTRPDKIVISYQGDGDLAAIGFNATFQAANRGEHVATFFVNNSTYGMTGGQMAPTTLLGQKTKTTPFGRNPDHEGYPLCVCEALNQLKAPVYIARVSVADTKRIMEAKKAIRKALEIQVQKKGFAFVEILSPCPTNLGLDPLKAAQWEIEQSEQIFPLGTFRDISAEAEPRKPAEPKPSPSEYFGGGTEVKAPEPDHAFGTKRIKIAGFGGQGILSLGLAIAEAARYSSRYSSWFPSYGPEQRGGSSSCNVVVSGTPIGSPDAPQPDVLVCMNRPSYDRFAKTVKAGGVILCDATVEITEQPPEGVKLYVMPSLKLATEFGVPKATNTVMLAALAHLGVTGLATERLLDALDDSFKKKPKLIPINRDIFQKAFAWCEENWKA